MKLVDILAREFKFWPEDIDAIEQDADKGVMKPGGCINLMLLHELADDWKTAIITRAEWQAAVDALNAPKVVEWDGFGFPPAGVTCEFTTNDGHNWKGCKILYADEVSILTGELEGKADRRLLRKCDADVKFRPALTAEQVASEDREKAINEMCSVFLRAKDSGIRLEDC